MKTTRTDRVRFFKLLDRARSRDDRTRMVARIELKTFEAKFGKDVCQKLYEEYVAKALEKEYKK